METFQERMASGRICLATTRDAGRLPCRWSAFGLTLLLLVASKLVFASESESGVAFAKIRVCIYSNGKERQLDVELAETPVQRARGLMMRDSLSPASGMLFIYSELQSARSGFWMYQTRIPLDVAFIAPDGTILRISAMPPCPEPVANACPIYRAGQPFQAALELNQGFFSAEGIREGDRIVRARSGECALRESQAAVTIHEDRP